MEAESAMFIRAPKQHKKDEARARGDRASGEETHERGAPLFERRVLIEASQPREYAEASGDRNPIHLDDQVARAAGLPGVILHGLCTMAMTTGAIIDACAGGEPERLRSIAVRFSRPVLPGRTITIRGWRGERSGEVVAQVKDDRDTIVMDQVTAIIEEEGQKEE